MHLQDIRDYYTLLLHYTIATALYKSPHFLCNICNIYFVALFCYLYFLCICNIMIYCLINYSVIMQYMDFSDVCFVNHTYFHSFFQLCYPYDWLLFDIPAVRLN